jgi:hypothetical protein
MDDSTVDVRQTVVAALEAVGEPLVVDAEDVQPDDTIRVERG